MHRPIAVLALCSFVALSAFAVQVGPETPVTTPTIDTAPHLRGTPRVASNGTDFLVAWYDQRGGATEIRATRVDRDGNLLDAESLLIGMDSGAALSVASDGADYLVAYNCHSSGPGICVARVDAETGVVAHTASVDGVNPSLASNGNGYLLIHQSGAQNLDVRGRALRGDGVAAGDPFEIGTSGYAPSVAANDDAYFVLWSTHAHLEGVLVSDSAVIGVKQRFTTAAPAFGLGPFTWSVASNGDDFFVAWQQNAGVVGTEYTTELRASRVSATGVASSATGVASSMTIGGDDSWQPHATWTGADYLVTYTYSTSPAIAPYLLFDATGDIRAVTVSANGKVFDAMLNIAVGPGRETASAAASNGAATLVTWENQHRPGTARIESSLVPRGGNAPAMKVISKSAGWQQNVVAKREAAGLFNRAIAWDEVTGDAQLSKVYVQRFDPSGAPLEGRGIPVAESQHHQRRPVFGRTMIAWIEEDPVTGAASVWWRGFYAQSATGPAELVDSPVRVADAAPGSRVSISHAHVFHVLFWESLEGRIKGVKVSMFARIGYDPLPFYVSPGPGDSNPVAAATYGNSVLVTWNRAHPQPVCADICFPPQHSIHAKVMDVLGYPPSSTNEIAGPDVSEPRPVFNGTDFFVFWSYPRYGTLARRVSVTGVPIGAELQLHPGILHDVVWLDGQFFMAVDEGARFAFLRLDAELIVVENVPFHARLADGEAMSLAPFWSGDFVLAYAARHPKEGASSRAVMRLVGENVASPRRRTVR